MDKIFHPSRCFTCAGCDVECPINLRTGALRPRSLVRLHALGLIDELTRDPSIWYCIQCDRCARACPMDVKPSGVIRDARNRALSGGIVSTEFVNTVHTLRRRLQIARRMAAYGVFNKGEQVNPSELWQQAGSLKCDLNGIPDTIQATGKRLQDLKAYRNYMSGNTYVASCWTCGSCTNSCPVAESSSIFSPMFIIRMVNLGQALLTAKTGESWLCVNCERCIEACPQGVKGAWIIRRLQDIAILTEEVTQESFEKWRNIDSELHRFFIRSVEAEFTAQSSNC